MVSSRALTVRQYLAELPPERREVIAAVRDLVNSNLPPGYVETMNWGMICWEIPMSRFSKTSNGHPLGSMALAAQKGNFALYSMAAYMSPDVTARLREAFRKAGLRLDMGKSCIRFKSLDALPAGVVEMLAASTTVERCIELYKGGRHGRVKPATKPAPRKTSRSTAPPKAAARRAAPARKAARPAAGAKRRAAKKRG